MEDKRDILLADLMEIYKQDFRDMEVDEVNAEYDQLQENIKEIEENIDILEVSYDYRMMYIRTIIKDMAHAEYMQEAFCIDDITEDMQEGWYNFIHDKMEENFGDDEKK